MIRNVLFLFSAEISSLLETSCERLRLSEWVLCPDTLSSRGSQDGSKSIVGKPGERPWIFAMKLKTKVADFASDLGEAPFVPMDNPIWTDLSCGGNTTYMV